MRFEPLVCVYFWSLQAVTTQMSQVRVQKNNTSGSDSLDVALCGQVDYLRICQAGLANIDRGSEASRPVWAETSFGSFPP